MKILHVTPHLGGGVGKAHSAIGAVLPEIVEQTFVLLEAPRDRRYADLIEQNGAKVVVADSLAQVAALARASDIVQFEFWNHPRMFECLARAEFPPMRSVFWSHISGVARPLIQPSLMAEAARFVFTTEASLETASVAMLRRTARGKLCVINSGFGFPGAQPRIARGRAPGIAYLGTVDFVKMHPGIFDVIDGLDGFDGAVSIWGEADPQGAVAARANAMRQPGRVVFKGATPDPAAALAGADIFLYPLQRDHYGTAENALVEAMSLGLVPLVLDNPAEKAIVRDGKTGFVASSIAEIGSLLDMLLLLPDVREKISHNAIRAIAETRTPTLSAQDFMVLWLGLLAEPARVCNFAGAIGTTPAEWFLSTQRLAGAPWQADEVEQGQTPAKGTLAHFEHAFEGDRSFALLRKTGA
jgi:glycosyltransferase involved in cell wall biosynthesis